MGAAGTQLPTAMPAAGVIGWGLQCGAPKALATPGFMQTNPDHTRMAIDRRMSELFSSPVVAVEHWL